MFKRVPLNKGDFTKTTLPIVWLLFTLIAVETYNLSSNLSFKLPMKTHQASFSGTITSWRKTAFVLKLIKVVFAKFFTSTAKT